MNWHLLNCHLKHDLFLDKYGYKMKYNDIKQKTDDELKTELLLLKKEQFNLRFQRATGQLENTARVRSIRRDIARIKTTLRSRNQQST